MQEIDELVDDWQPQSLVEAPTELDELTLSSVPVIHGSNGVHVKLAPNGKTVRPLVQLNSPFSGIGRPGM